MYSHFKKELFKYCVMFLIMTIIFALFGFIYGLFTRGVYSYFMIYAFLIPLLGGVVPFGLFTFRASMVPNPSVLQMYAGGITMLTFGSVVKGILDIYEAINPKVGLYPILGIIMIFMAAVLHIAGVFASGITEDTSSDLL